MSNEAQYGFVNDDLMWYESSDPKGYTALIWKIKHPAKPWRVMVSYTSTGAKGAPPNKHFETFEAAREYCLKVTKNVAA
tara:strand:- start:185 stop:421 length:237 start_codon:yes stop_codon:yes gene_type:complete